MTRAARRQAKEEEPKPLTPAEKLGAMLDDHISPERLDVLHDQFKLLGLVMGQRALLVALLDPTASVKDKVSAAKTLVTMPTEKPEVLVDRLRSSVFSSLSAETLETIITKVGEQSPDQLPKLSLEQLIHDTQEQENGST